MRRSLTIRLLGVLMFCALPFLGACTTTQRPWSFKNRVPDVYQQLDDEEVDELRQAIQVLESGDLMGARAMLASLVSRAPGDVHAGIWQQEARIAWGERRAELLTGVTEATHSPRDLLRDQYRRDAGETPTALNYLLAARLEEDELAAQLLLKQALELDPRMSWAHYALAHVAARVGDWVSARAELERTFELQPDHLPALRLYGWLLAEAGDTDGAITAMETWLDQSSNDLLASGGTLDEVRLDLALAYNANGESGKALEMLSTLVPGQVDEVRRLTAMAVVEEGRGEWLASRRAAQAARRIDGDALLPAVQDALLLEFWLKDLEAAKQAWAEVIEMASRSEDVAAGLQRFRAEVHLQRLEGRGATSGEVRP